MVTSEVLCSNWGTIYLSVVKLGFIKNGQSPEDVIRIVIKDLGKFGVIHVSQLEFCRIEEDKTCFLSFQGVKVIGKLFSIYKITQKQLMVSDIDIVGLHEERVPQIQ